MTAIVTMAGMTGGYGRTTLALLFAHHAARAGHLRVLAVDLDPMATLSRALLDEDAYASHVRWNPTILQLLAQGHEATALPCTPAALIRSIERHDAGGWLDLAAADMERGLMGPYAKSVGLVPHLLSTLAPSYDLIIVDTTPAGVPLNRIVFASSTHIAVPVMTHSPGMIGLRFLAEALSEDAALCKRHLDIRVVPSSPIASAPQADLTQIRKFSETAGWTMFTNELPFSEAYRLATGARAGLDRFSFAEPAFVRLGDEFLAWVGLVRPS